MSEPVASAPGGAAAPLRLPRVGELAPDFTLPATDGGMVHLAEQPRPVVLVFLRHLA